MTNIEATVMDGSQIVTAYHDLWRIEESFRMTKSDLAARPMSCRRRHDIGYADVWLMPTCGTKVLVRAGSGV